MTDLPPDERTILLGLAQSPERIEELQSIDIKHATSHELKIVLTVMRSHRIQASLAGRRRFAPASLVVSLARKRLAKTLKSTSPEHKARRRLAEATISCIDSIMCIESKSIDAITHHEFRAAIDAIIESSADDIAAQRLLDISKRFKSNGARGIAKDIANLASEIASVSSGQEISTLSDDASQALIDYDNAKRGDSKRRIATGHVRIDSLTGGGCAGRLWLVAGYAKDGKTQLAKEFVYAASEAKFGCFVVTAEQQRSDVRTMMILRHSHNFINGGIDHRRYDRGTLSPSEESALRASVADLSSGSRGAISYWQASRGTTVSDIAAVAEQVSRKHPVDLIMVDHTMLFEPTNPQRSDVAKLAEVLRELKQLSLDFKDGRGAWVVACHQISRDGRDFAEKRGGYYLPRDLGGSSEAERSADVAIGIYRDQQMQDLGEVRISVMLDRRGPGDVQGWPAHGCYESAAILPIVGV